VRALPVQNPTGRWDRTSVQFDGDEGATPNAELFVMEDHSRSIVSKNDSPDVGFSYSVNPYRGCFHGCAYCYARPGHEFLSMGAGTDFERRIVYKPKAAVLLREAFDKPSWSGELIVFSGVTDCYQPLEHKLQLTRSCLEVCALYKNPVGIITKAPLIERDIDVLQELARVARVRVTISIPFATPEYAKALEPYVTTSARRFRIIERLASAGIPVGLSVAPVICGLNDTEMPTLLQQAKDAGATHAFYVLLRLPGPVAQVFEERVKETLPLRAERILRRVRETHGGTLYRSEFHLRQRGAGVHAEMVSKLFEQARARLGFAGDEAWSAGQVSTFARPGSQMSLF